MITWVASRDYFATIDADRQVVIIAHRAAWLPGETTREIPFEEIESVFVYFRQDSAWSEPPASEEYQPPLRIKRHRLIGVQLKGGEIVTLREESTNERYSPAEEPDPKQGDWEALARHVSDILHKPLFSGAPLPGGSHTFIDAIDELLQARLQQSPLHGQTVHLRGKGFGVEIVVNGKPYEGVDDIPDESVRLLVRSAIDEWQHASHPKIG
jgi:hypothetical protein